MHHNLEKILDIAQSVCQTEQCRWQIDSIQFHYDGYQEPGYTDPENGVIATGNWNNITEWKEKEKEEGRGQFITVDDTMGRLSAIFEKMGIELEWEDEWTTCEECNGLLRTCPDSYSWTPSYVQDEGSTLCMECLDPQEHLENLERNAKTCNCIGQIDPAEHGYLLIQDGFEHGFHQGMDASPQKIAALLEENGVTRYLFHIAEQSQFYSTFSVYLHEEERGLLSSSKRVLETGQTDGPSVSGAMKASLQEAATQASALKQAAPSGIVYSRITPEGAKTKIVSLKEFVKGIKDD